MYHAEDVNYWKTGKSGPDSWLEKAKLEIRRAGGTVIGSATVNDDLPGQAAFMLAFKLKNDEFKIKWPVLQSKRGHHEAARRQAATALYHEVKSACVKVKFLGERSAFLAYLTLSDGRTAAEVGSPELLKLLPGPLGLTETRDQALIK